YYLKEEKRHIAEDGKEILQRKLNHLGLQLNSNNAHEIATFYKYLSPLDLYYAIAVGAIDLKGLKDFTIIGDKIIAPVKEPKIPDNKLNNNHLEKPSKDTELIIFGESSDK